MGGVELCLHVPKHLHAVIIGPRVKFTLCVTNELSNGCVQALATVMKKEYIATYKMWWKVHNNRTLHFECLIAIVYPSPIYNSSQLCFPYFRQTFLVQLINILGTSMKHVHSLTMKRLLVRHRGFARGRDLQNYMGLIQLNKNFNILKLAEVSVPRPPRALLQLSSFLSSICISV